MGLPLAGCTVISLRPSGTHDGMRRAAAKQGARLLALSPWRLRDRADPRTRATLATALGAPRVVFTSPAAVAAAAKRPVLVKSNLPWGIGAPEAARGCAGLCW